MIRNVNRTPACLPLHLIVSALIQELVTSPERHLMEHPEGT
ncbi:rCG60193 [Rattus norvegicus]|uniref:RCG60193 n=1 Tax=Rattus norvegicus TaxID=10116 RepID=A6HTC3_RAT|nr:rCG60193 [Rattus norvegicus]